MYTIKTLQEEYLKYVNVRYCLKFVLIGGLLHVFNLMWIGATVPGGNYYFPFLKTYFDYPSLIRYTVLHIARFISGFFGVHSAFTAADAIQVPSGGGVVMGWPCYGIGIMIVWTAFVIADTIHIKSRIRWLLMGLMTIWLVNCLRVAVLLIAIQYNWAAVTRLDQHATFNNLSYLFLVLLVYSYYRKFHLSGQ